MASLPPNKVAAILFALCAIAPAGIWVILLFIANPPTVSVLDQLHAMLAPDNPARGLLIWLASFVLLSTLLSAGYLGSFAFGRLGASLLLALSCAQAVAAGLVVALPMGLIFAVPIYWGVQSWQRT